MAGATPIYSLPYPEPSDLVANYPALGQDLAEDLDGILASKLSLADQTFAQVVRATDATARTTTSTSFVDADISVTITPQKAANKVMLLWILRARLQNSTNDDLRGSIRLASAANNPVPGASNFIFGSLNITGTGTREISSVPFLIGWASPATTSAVTFKGQFSVADSNTTFTMQNNIAGTSLYAIEVKE